MSTASSSEIISSQRAARTVAVPDGWRKGQFALLFVLTLLAAWFGTLGFKSPSTETGAADNFHVADLAGFLVMGAIIWLTTPTAWTIASTTFQEAIRRRWLTALLGFAVVMIAISTFFTWMQPGEEQKFLRDFGVGFTVIMTLIVAIFLGVALVPPEIERRTIFTILSKPVTRVEFLLGKYLGLCLVLLLNIALMSLMFLACYALFLIRQEGSIGAALMADNQGVSKQGMLFDLWNMSKALGLQYGLVTVMGAVAILLSQVLANITAIISSFVVYFAGQSAPYWEHLARDTGAGPSFGALVSGLVSTLYFFLPRLDRFEVRERLVNDLPIHFNYILKAESSGAIYVAAMLALAYFVFGDREF